MRTLEIKNVPDDVVSRIETLARVRGQSVDEVAADYLRRAIELDDEREAALLAEIRAEREQMEREGIWTTAEEVQRAKQWGRE